MICAESKCCNEGDGVCLSSIYYHALHTRAVARLGALSR